MRRLTPEAAGMGARARPGDEVLVLDVHGGEVMLLAPAGALAAPEAAPRVLRGALWLENERVLNFEVAADGLLVLFHDTPMANAERVDDEATRESAPGAGPTVTAADIMTREVITTLPQASVRELAKRLTYHRISGMPVVDDQGTVVGVVSEADIISKRGTTVADIMTTPVISASEATTALEVAAILTRERIKRVPVVRDGRLIGLIGRSNVVSWVGSQGQG